MANTFFNAHGRRWRPQPMARSAAGFLLALLLPGLEPRAEQSSTNYIIDDLSVSGAAGQATSARFDLLVTVAESEPVGSTSFCNGGFAASLGFLSAFGEAPVANLLFVTRSQANPAHVDLVWSGSAQRFDVYRHSLAATLVDPSHLLTTTTECVAVDSNPFAGRVLYYTVIPEGS